MSNPPQISVAALEALAADDAMMEVARKAIEKTLIEWRNRGLSELGRGNGLVVRSRNGKDSCIIRMGPELAMSIGLRAIAARYAK